MNVLSQRGESCEVSFPQVRGRTIFAQDAKHGNVLHILGVYDTEEKTDLIYQALIECGKDNVAMPEA